jgi:prepilin-type N-terminal cleavage/methylation domain-containing protein
LSALKSNTWSLVRQSLCHFNNYGTFIVDSGVPEMEGNKMTKTRKKEAGFNLIELMIVIAVIALLISISGYAWQVMIRRGNEAAAVGFINKINTAQAYFASKKHGEFATTFRQLVQDNLLDQTLNDETPVIDGYRFRLRTDDSPGSFYSINADPVIGEGIRATGTSRYYLDSAIHAIRRTEEQRSANSSDPSL